jgi:hypothetical protein
VIVVGLLATLGISIVLGLIEYFKVLPSPQTLPYILLKFIIYGLLLAGVSKL